MYRCRFLNGAAWFYNIVITCGSSLQSVFLLYMRLTWGSQFLITGWGKLHAIEKVSTYFASLHISYPVFNAYLVGAVEMIGGFLLIIGLGSRLVAIPLMIVMFMALGTAHADQIADFRFLLVPKTLVAQTPYPYLITCLLVFIFGPGRVSIDAWIKRCLSKCEIQ